MHAEDLLLAGEKGRGLWVINPEDAGPAQGGGVVGSCSRGPAVLAASKLDGRSSPGRRRQRCGCHAGGDAATRRHGAVLLRRWWAAPLVGCSFGGAGVAGTPQGAPGEAAAKRVSHATGGVECYQRAACSSAVTPATARVHSCSLSPGCPTLPVHPPRPALAVRRPTPATAAAAATARPQRGAGAEVWRAPGDQRRRVDRPCH